MSKGSLEEQNRRRARREAVRLLECVASGAKPTITYGDLADRIRAATGISYPPNGSSFSELLCDISRKSNADRGVMLSAVVVHAHDGLPGEGFFDLARNLGRPEDEDEELWKSELDRVVKAWSDAGNTPT